MASVMLKRDFFGPDGTLYLTRDNPHSFPAAWDLPKDAEKGAASAVADDEEEPVKATPAPKK